MVLNGTGLFFLTLSVQCRYIRRHFTSINQSSDHQFIIKGKLQLLTTLPARRENDPVLASISIKECIMQGSWFRLLFYKKEIMVCNDTGLIVRYIPFSPVRVVKFGPKPNTEYTRLD
ncbi:ABC-type transporter [Trichinella spiralis]|uniref:ABC-type transporter n=1 Tax=Trichinella spiralis TaxID=6334 RepID=A0ABR3KWF8_TRISP